MRFYLNIQDHEITDFIARIYPWKSINERDDFLDEKIAPDAILQKEYGINFDTYKKVLCDIIKFTNVIPTKNGKYRYALECDNVPICISDEIDTELQLNSMCEDDRNCMIGIFPTCKTQ